MTRVVVLCAFCGEEGEFADLFGLTLSPPENADAWQQWWVHGRCIREAFASDFLRDLREELERALPTEEHDE